MPKISVIIITLNEEKNIERCIKSVQPIADEILVVDSFSTDSTEEIVKKLGATFIENTFQDFVEQHIFADQQAKYDHILTVDADEQLSQELIASIKVVKKYWKNDAYFMNRMTNYCGKWIKHSGWYPDKKLRLYDRRKGKWIGRKVHERFIMLENSTTGHLKGDLLHYSFYTISQHVIQANKFTDLTATGDFEKGKRSNLVKIFFAPIFKFVRDYFFNFGFLDGYYGFIICQISANATFLKYVKIRQLQKGRLN